MGVHPQWQWLIPEAEFAFMPFDTIRFLDRPCEYDWSVQFYRCPQCARLVACLRVKSLEDMHRNTDPAFYRVWPRHAVTKPISPHVPVDIAADLTEARSVLADRSSGC